jgi:hypothetical protein
MGAATSAFPLKLSTISLSSAAATGVSSTAVARTVLDETGSDLEIIPIGLPERPLTDIEAWNVGLISASRPELTATQNHVRNLALLSEMAHFGRYWIRERDFIQLVDGWALATLSRSSGRLAPTPVA